MGSPCRVPLSRLKYFEVFPPLKFSLDYLIILLSIQQTQTQNLFFFFSSIAIKKS